MIVITKNNEELKVKEIHFVNKDNLPGILFTNQIQRFKFEKEDYENGLHEYEIKRVGNLSLCFKTFLNKAAKDTEIDICQWSEDFSNRWTIASFEPHYEDDYLEGYELNSCGNRLNDKSLNWKDFGELVKCGYNWLEEHTDKNKDD